MALIFGFATESMASLDLHAHLDLKPGVGFYLQGAFDEAPRAESWDVRLKTKASSLSLSVNENEPRIIVVSLYAHPYLSNQKPALDLEYEHLSEFTRQHSSEWTIAKTPAEAREAIKNGKHVFILSIEGADQVLETETDYKKWIDERGVAIVTPFHLTEDHLGGVALLRNGLAFFNSPIRFFQSVLLTGGACLKDFCKSYMGIKPDGEIVIQNLMTRKVWVDLAHANDMEIDSLIPIFESRKLPLLVTHTQIRETYPGERGLSPNEITYLTKHDGIIGLLPTGDMLNHPLPNETKSSCTSKLARFKESFRMARTELGTLKVALGSDVNAPINGLSPLCEIKSGQEVSELEQKGYYTYSQWKTLSNYVSEDPNWNAAIIEKFLSLWEQVRAN